MGDRLSQSELTTPKTSGFAWIIVLAWGSTLAVGGFAVCRNLIFGSPPRTRQEIHEDLIQPFLGDYSCLGKAVTLSLDSKLNAFLFTYKSDKKIESTGRWDSADGKTLTVSIDGPAGSVHSTFQKIGSPNDLAVLAPQGDSKASLQDCYQAVPTDPDTTDQS